MLGHFSCYIAMLSLNLQFVSLRGGGKMALGNAVKLFGENSQIQK